MIKFHHPYEISIRNKKTYSGQGIYIGRPSLLGNPFTIGKNGTRSEVIEKYRIYFQDKIKSNIQFQEEVIKLFLILEKEKKLDLICWCSPCACHGDIVKDFLLEMME